MAGKNDHRRLNDMVPVTNKDWRMKKKLSRPTDDVGAVDGILPKIRNILRQWEITIYLTMVNHKVFIS